jgi:glycosyltransferase involved in cell wall biosynthesis
MILAAYNSERIIPLTLQALISQDYDLSRAELIVVDGGSSDSTVRILRDFLSRHGSRFGRSELIIHDRNYGVSRARNDGIRASRGRYILILDHDVIMQKDTVSVLVKYLQSAPQRVAAVMPLHRPACGSKLALWEYRIRRGRKTRTNAITSCALVRREVVEEIGL